jgi:hypothetical protein
MSNVSSSDEGAGESGTVSELAFVKTVKDLPAVFSELQNPEARKEKAKSLKEIKQRYVKNFGKDITETQVLKKINNMKTRLKKKTDIKRTGNKQINLKEWEQLLWDCLQGDSNPIITKIPGKAEYFKLKIMQVLYKLFLDKIMLQLFFVTKGVN